MKAHILFIIIALLFFGSEVSGQEPKTEQANGSKPSPAMPPTSQNVESSKPTIFAPPGQPNDLSNLEKELTKLVSSLNGYVTLKSKPTKRDIKTDIMDFLTKLVALIGAILGCFVTYKGLKKVPVINNDKEILATLMGVVALAVIFYFLSGLVTSAVYIIIALIILAIALVLAAAHFLKFIDDKYPDIKDSIIEYFTASSMHRNIRKTVRNNVRLMEDWLSNIVFVQIIGGETELQLDGSVVEGYDRSKFTVEPYEKIASHWRNIDDRMLVPIKARRCARD